MKSLYMLIAFLVLVQAVNASHQAEVDYKVPERVVTTVGELTNIKIDLINKGSRPYSFQIKLKAALQNGMEITNSDINIQSLSPSQTTSVFSNVRTLTENPNLLTIEIYRDNDFTHSVSTGIPVNSKKLSLPEFGLTGFLQIAAIAAVLYFLFNVKATRQ